MQSESDDLRMRVILDFAPVRCGADLNQYPDGSVPPTISMDLRIEPDEDIRTPDERSLREIEWSISLSRGRTTNEHVKRQDAIGLCNYHEAMSGIDYDIAEGCPMWAHLDEGTFDSLFHYLLSGRLPDGIRVHASGMRYGWEPDGTGKVWDVNKTPSAAIHQLEICLPFQAPTTPPSDDDDAVEIYPAPSAEFQRLEILISDSIAKPLKSVGILMGWAVLILGVICAVLLFR